MRFGTQTIERGLWVVGILLSLLFLLRLMKPSFIISDRAAGPVHPLSSNVQEIEGIFSNNDQSRDLKMVLQKIWLKPKEEYRVSFVVEEVKGPEPVILTVDFLGENYDFGKKKFSMKLMPVLKPKL